MLKQTVIKSAGWAGLASIVIYGINAITKILLARFLFPEDFGLFAMAFFFISFLTMFIGFGIGDFLVVSKDKFEKNASVAFLLTTVIGVTLFLLSFFSAPLISSFFQNKELTLIIRVLSVMFVFDSVVVIFRAFLMRELHFFRKSMIEITSAIVYGGVVIALAYLGHGVWSIVFASVIQHFILLLLFVLLSPWKSLFSFTTITLKDAISILKIGTQFFSGTFLAWTVTTIDNVIVGKRLGEAQLGYYSFGYNIANMPVTGFTHIFTGIFQSVYAKLSQEKQRLQKAYILSLRWTLLFVLPAAGGLFVLSDFFIQVVIGEKWLPMLPILLILALYSPMRCLSTLQAHLLEALGFPKKEAFFLLIEVVILLLLIYPLITFYGIIGAALTAFFARTSTLFLRTKFTYQFTAVSWREIFCACKSQLFAMLIMIVTIYTAKTLLFQAYTLLHFLILIGLGVLVYGLVVCSTDKQLLLEAKEILRTYI